jgi:hypothetical protein
MFSNGKLMISVGLVVIDKLLNTSELGGVK